MGKTQIITENAPKAIGPYSQAVEAGPFVFVSGQIPIDPATKEMVAGDVAAATEQVLRNLGAVLESAGLGFGDVVKTTVFLADLGDFDAMNQVYAKYFPMNCPARACVQVAALPKGAPVEIEAIAARSEA